LFKALTPEIDALAKKFSRQILELETLFDRRTNLYLDYANLKNWSSKLGWGIDMCKLKQLLGCFDTIHEVKLYYGTIAGNDGSEKRIEKLKGLGYKVITKPVKIIRLSIDVSSLSSNTATNILCNFVAPELLKKLKVESIVYLNDCLRELNKQGIARVEHMKCNFDVETGRDMLLDHVNLIEGFSLWSGDSDFADPLAQLLRDGKKVTLFATARRVASELSELQPMVWQFTRLGRLRSSLRNGECPLKAKRTPCGALKPRNWSCDRLQNMHRTAYCQVSHLTTGV
jgi:uncharacterized LabA/DUF88 family protein